MWNATKLRTSNGFTWIGQGCVCKCACNVSVRVRCMNVCVWTLACICAFAKPTWRTGITIKIRIFLPVLDSVLIEQCPHTHTQYLWWKLQWWRSALTTQYPFYLRALDKYDTQKEKAVQKKSTARRRGSLDSWKNSSARICVGVLVHSCDCERAYVQVYLEKVKNECRKTKLRNQNATMMASLVDRWMDGRTDGWCFYLM